jgi:cytochrome b561
MCSGMYVAAVEVAPPVKEAITSFNVSLTTVFIPFFAWRVWHALATPRPPHTQIGRLNQRIAAMAHLSLYVLVVVVQVSGVLMMDREYSLFGLFMMPKLMPDAAINEHFAYIHKMACRLLAGLVLVHVLAVVHHGMRGRDILSRMV